MPDRSCAFDDTLPHQPAPAPTPPQTPTSTPHHTTPQSTSVVYATPSNGLLGTCFGSLLSRPTFHTTIIAHAQAICLTCHVYALLPPQPPGRREQCAIVYSKSSTAHRTRRCEAEVPLPSGKESPHCPPLQASAAPPPPPPQQHSGGVRGPHQGHLGTTRCRVSKMSVLRGCGSPPTSRCR